MKSGPLKIFVPESISSHVYLNQLYGHLRELEIECDGFNEALEIRKFPGTREILTIKKILNSDIIHLHWIEFYIRSKDSLLLTHLKLILFISGIILLRYLVRTKIVITLHNIKPHEIIYPRLENLGFRLSLNLANSIIVHNNWSKEATIQNYKIEREKISVIPIGNFIGYYPNEITKEQARLKLKIPEDVFVILYFGLIRNYKGIDNIISALDDIDNNIWMVICGKSSDDKIKEQLCQFKKRFENCLINLEYILDEEIQDYMNAADIGILPYKEASTSAVLILFASFKKTVIVPDLEPIRETIGDAAIYYIPGNIEDLRRAIVLSKHLNLTALSEASFNKISEYNWRNIAATTNQLYHKLVNR